MSHIVRGKPLENKKHEAFAQAIARGVPREEAITQAGYKSSPANAPSSASKIMRLESVKARIAELSKPAPAPRKKKPKPVRARPIGGKSDPLTTALAALAEAQAVVLRALGVILSGQHLPTALRMPAVSHMPPASIRPMVRNAARPARPQRVVPPPVEIEPYPEEYATPGEPPAHDFGLSAMYEEAAGMVAGEEEPPPPPTDDEMRDIWVRRVGVYLDSGVWHPGWGDRPSQEEVNEQRRQAR